MVINEIEVTAEVRQCAKCNDPLQSNNEFTCQDDKRVCGKCWLLYLEHVRKFFT